MALGLPGDNGRRALHDPLGPGPPVPVLGTLLEAPLQECYPAGHGSDAGGLLGSRWAHPGGWVGAPEGLSRGFELSLEGFVWVVG